MQELRFFPIYYFFWHFSYQCWANFDSDWIQQTTKPLNGSDTSTAISWFGRMYKQVCGHFFANSAAVDLPLYSQRKLKLMAFFSS
jgi:hypothetical protein